MSAVIGIDIGGTNIKGALFDADGTILERATAPTRDGESCNGTPVFAEGVRELVVRFEKSAGLSPLPVGISAPGLAKRDGSSIGWMPGRMNGIENLVWSDSLKRNAVVLNDAHAALLGEVWCGAARDCKDVLMLTLGTGVGGAAMCDGRLIRGHIGRAGHFGHVTVDSQGQPTITGMPGGLENAIGNATVSRRSGGRFAMTSDLITAVKAGDAFAKEVWETSVRALAAGVASLINAFDPKVVILGGGIASGAGVLLMSPLSRWMDEFEWRPGGVRVKVVSAQLGEWAGACGAAWQMREDGAA